MLKFHPDSNWTGMCVYLSRSKALGSPSCSTLKSGGTGGETTSHRERPAASPTGPLHERKKEGLFCKDRYRTFHKPRLPRSLYPILPTSDLKTVALTSLLHLSSARRAPEDGSRQAGGIPWRRPGRGGARHPGNKCCLPISHLQTVALTSLLYL